MLKMVDQVAIKRKSVDMVLTKSFRFVPCSSSLPLSYFFHNGLAAC